MKIGDKDLNHAAHGYGAKHRSETVYGVCVYIHPRRRYYTLAFSFEGGSYRESYPFRYRKGEQK